jgi:hypothetical protein
VTVSAHTKIGIRISDMPGARMRKTVTRKLMELRIEATPTVTKAIRYACWPRLACWLKGGYAVQPLSKPPSSGLMATSRIGSGRSQ